MAAVGDDRVQAITRRWSVGDYPAVGALFAPAARSLVDAVDVTDRDVLDAACGPGTVAIAAAQAGARRVTGVDITPRLLEVARQRVHEAEVDVDLLAGDLLDLPLADDAVDVTLSSFGAFTADDPFACAAELARVTRSGGTVGVTAWRGDGLLGEHEEVLALLPADVRAAAHDQPRPYAWADRAGLAVIVADTPLRVRSVEVGEVVMPFPSVATAMDWFLTVSGPMMEARDAVVGLGIDEQDLRSAFATAWSRFAEFRPDGGVDLHAAYGLALLEVA